MLFRSDNAGLVAVSLGKRFKKRPVVRGVSLSVQRGEAVGLLGPNGAGKTTCFYILSGLIAPDYGTIFLDGHEITSLPMYRRAALGMGYLSQEGSVFRGLSVEDNVRAVLETLPLSSDEREDRLRLLLEEEAGGHGPPLCRRPPRGAHGFPANWAVSRRPARVPRRRRDNPHSQEASNTWPRNKIGRAHV